MKKTDKPDLSLFTMDKYEAITKYKTSYYTFQMPVGLALLMTGVDDPETHRQAKTILLEMGEFFQIQVSLFLHHLGTSYCLEGQFCDSDGLNLYLCHSNSCIKLSSNYNGPKVVFFSYYVG